MLKNQGVLERYLDAMTKTGDITLRYWYQRQMMLDSLLTEKELDRIADKVIERMNITVDASDVINAIDDIQKRLNNLGG